MIGMIIKHQMDKSETAWPELTNPDNVILLSNEAPPMKVVILHEGMASGKPSVAIRIDLPDGQSLIVETTARLMATLGNFIQARYPNLLEGD